MVPIELVPHRQRSPALCQIANRSPATDYLCKRATFTLRCRCLVEFSDLERAVNRLVCTLCSRCLLGATSSFMMLRTLGNIAAVARIGFDLCRRWRHILSASVGDELRIRSGFVAAPVASAVPVPPVSR